jgi:peptidoglycan-associated lipoprotein
MYRVLARLSRLSCHRRARGVAVAVLASAALSACASSNPPEVGSRLGSDSDYADKGGRSDNSRYGGSNGVDRGQLGPVAAFKAEAGDLVYFSSDSSDLTPEAQQTLASQARWLQQYPGQTVAIEGHADERGTREYNIALGARRATTVQRYLASQGVSAQRIRTISYGKERPVASCDDISCWSKNRRAQTTLGAAATASR